MYGLFTCCTKTSITRSPFYRRTSMIRQQTHTAYNVMDVFFLGKIKIIVLINCVFELCCVRVTILVFRICAHVQV